MLFRGYARVMTEFMVTVVWDRAPDGAQEALESVDGAWEASSAGQLVTGVPVTADSLPSAYWDALALLVPVSDGSGAQPVAVTIEPVSATPHFMLAAYGR